MLKVVSFVLHRFRMSWSAKCCLENGLECFRLLQIVSDCSTPISIVFEYFTFSLNVF